MIIACPACSTRYAVADSSIGVNGRVVRCAKCRHSWFQDGPEQAEAPLPVPPEPEPAPAILPDPTTTHATPPATDTPAAYVASPLEAASNHYANVPDTRDFADTPSSFAHEPPFRPRRHPATVWVIALMLLALVALVAVAAVAEYGVPDWLPLPHGAVAAAEGAFGEAQPNLVLDFPQDRQERRPLPNGGAFFNVSGSIRNNGNSRRTVPTLLILLRDGRNHVVYSLQTAAPKSVLAPGESETIDQAIIDAPNSVRSAEIRWKPR